VDKKFNFYIPLDVYKDGTENWRVKGVASTEDKDLQGEVIKQNGLDISVLKAGKGYLNWEHKSDPKNIIGLIDKAIIGDNGLEIEGQLFQKHDQAKAIHQILDSLDGKRKHRIQMSVEGKVIQKSEDGNGTKYIDKAKVTAVALTMNPVNESTYTELIKSLSHSEGDPTGDEFASSFSSSTPSDDIKPEESVSDVVKTGGANEDSNISVGDSKGDPEGDKLDKTKGVQEDQTILGRVEEKVALEVEEKREDQQAESVTDYLYKRLEGLNVNPMDVMEELTELLEAQEEGEENFREFVKSLEGNPFAKDIIKAVGHKHIKREMRGDKYVYYYKDPKTGKVTAEGDSGKKDEKKEPKASHDYDWGSKEAKAHLDSLTTKKLRQRQDLVTSQMGIAFDKISEKEKKGGTKTDEGKVFSNLQEQLKAIDLAVGKKEKTSKSQNIVDLIKSKVPQSRWADAIEGIKNKLQKK